LLVGAAAHAACAAPVPAPEVAEAQLRALNYRFVGATVEAGVDMMETLTHTDFVLTDRDGSWRDRAEFVARARRQEPLPSAAGEGMQVRLFGPVALVHGVFHEPPPAGQRSGRPGRVRYTDVYVWNATGWQLVSVQHTALADHVAVPARTDLAPTTAPWTGRDPRGDDTSILAALNDRYVAAFRDADVAWYDAHLAPDYVMVAGDGSLLDRAATLTRFAQPTFATTMRTFPVGRVTVRRFLDVALIHAENDYELKDGRRGISRYTDIWLARDGRWLCIAAHITVYRAAVM
jgi:ketosteroid isomerase-like protein